MQVLTRLAQHPAEAPHRPLDIAAVIGHAAWERLPRTVQRRFAKAHHATAYDGALDLHCSAIGRCFAVFTAIFGGPLLTTRHENVPAQVRVHCDESGGVVWDRRLSLPGSRAVHTVRSTKLAGAGNTVIERTDGGLAMELDVFEEDQALVFQSRRYFLAVGAWRIPVPMAFTPGVCRVEHRDEGAGRFRFTMAMVHPWWGLTIHQTGVFNDPKEE